MTSKSKCITLLFLFSLLVGGCATVVPPPLPGPEGCQPPPADVFRAAGIDIKFAQSTFGKVITGDVNIKTDPQVISLASKAVIDSRIRSYLRCLAIKQDGYTPEQAAYFDRKADFMSTNPTTEQYLRWESENPPPFPSRSRQLTPSESSIIDLKHRIASLRGTYERSYQYDENSVAWQTAIEEVRKNASNLALILSKLPDEQMRIQFQIAKYEYSSYGYVLASLVEKNRKNRLGYANHAVIFGRKALELIKDVERDVREGGGESERLLLSFKEDDKENRIYYVIAMALSIKVSNDDGTTLQQVAKEWNTIDARYREIYPPIHPKIRSIIEKIEEE